MDVPDTRRVLTVLSLLYSGMLVYASLMPFDLQPASLTVPDLRDLWRGWPLDMDARISGSDLVSNLALYIPLGWMATVRFLLNRRGARPLLSLLAAALLCSFLSACIECLQLVSAFRTASAADWLLNTVSGAAGAALAATGGTRLWAGGNRWLRTRWYAHPLDVASLTLVGLITADALAPYLPTILLKEVWQSLKHSHFSLASGMAEHPWHWWLLTRVLVYSVLVMMLSAWGGRHRTGHKLKRLFLAGAAAAMLALVLEVSKLMIASRVFNTGNVATSWAGCCLGVMAGWGLEGRITARRKVEWSIAALLAYVLYLAWSPFQFTWESERFRSLWPSPVELLPFYHYAMGSELNHARLFIQSVFFQGLLVYLLRIRFGWFEHSPMGVVLAALAVGTLGLLQEAGQFFLPSRTPSATDIYCFALGGALGAWIRRPPTHGLPLDGKPPCDREKKRPYSAWNAP